MCVFSCLVSYGALGAHGTCYSSVAKAYFYLICCHLFFCCETNKAVCHSVCWLMSLLKMLGLGRRGMANSSHLFKFWRILGNPFITGLVVASWLPLTLSSMGFYSSICLCFTSKCPPCLKIEVVRFKFLLNTVLYFNFLWMPKLYF